jgi:hypothetical protein
MMYQMITIATVLLLFTIACIKADDSSGYFTGMLFFIFGYLMGYVF